MCAFWFFETEFVIKPQRRCKISVTSLNELKLRIVAAIETVAPQMLENTSRATKYRLDILREMKGVHVEVLHVQYWFYSQ
jgi:hypothetical protein